MSRRARPGREEDLLFGQGHKDDISEINMTTETICKPVTTEAAWRGDAIKAGETWIYHLSDA